MGRFYVNPAEQAERAATDRIGDYSHLGTGSGATAEASRKPAPVPTLLFSKADVDKAAGKARAEERQRIKTVFASEHSKGRERLCATLLGAPDGWAASDITARLANMPDDRQFAAKISAPANAAADAVWARASAKVGAAQ